MHDGRGSKESIGYQVSDMTCNSENNLCCNCNQLPEALVWVTQVQSSRPGQGCRQPPFGVLARCTGVSSPARGVRRGYVKEASVGRVPTLWYSAGIRRCCAHCPINPKDRVPTPTTRHTASHAEGESSSARLGGSAGEDQATHHLCAVTPSRTLPRATHPVAPTQGPSRSLPKINFNPLTQCKLK